MTNVFLDPLQTSLGEQRSDEIPFDSRQRLSRSLQTLLPSKWKQRPRSSLDVRLQGPSGLWKGVLTSLAYNGLVIATDNFLQDIIPMKK